MNETVPVHVIVFEPHVLMAVGTIFAALFIVCILKFIDFVSRDPNRHDKR